MMIFSRVFLLSLMVTAANAFVVPPASTSATTVRPQSSSRLQVAVDTSDIKNGLTVEIDGEPFKVMSFSIMKQARGAAKTTIKFKSLTKGTTIENTYRSGEKFETAMIEKKDAQFTYEDDVRSWRCISCCRSTAIFWIKESVGVLRRDQEENFCILFFGMF